MSNQDTICGYQPYPNSINNIQGKTLFMAKKHADDVLIVVDGNLGFAGEDFDFEGTTCRIAHLTHENADHLRKLVPFTAPRQGLSSDRSLGAGDRLGLAGPGHIRVFQKYDVFPILAQQSIRELNLTGRTYDDVLDSVTFAVYRAGFKRGFGADGDHLKKPEELEYALRCGYSMITLDCSEHIRNDVEGMDMARVNQEYIQDSDLEQLYLNKTFDIGEGYSLTFGLEDFKRMVLIYKNAILFATDIYNQFIKGKPIDFEISIDETDTPTTPLQHYFVASELKRRGVEFATIAPRFCGEFQKGVDYIGSLEQFEKEFAVHAAIGRLFDYKISVHSGSDKFSVFPIVGRLSRGRFHLKTAGTNWLEAVRLVAMKNPALYRELHEFALVAFKEASQYYHVTTQINRIPDASMLSDEELPDLFELNDARQLIHITYGLILTEKNPDGRFRFRDRLYDLWDKHAEDYAFLLEQHIGRHLELLNSSKVDERL